MDNDLDVVATGLRGAYGQISDSAKSMRRGDPPQITQFAVWICSLYRLDSYGFVGFACLR